MRCESRRQPRRGVALLIVLATTLLLTGALMVWLRQAAVANQAEILNRIDVQLATSLHWGEQVAVRWLERHGNSVVAPPAGGSWTILNDVWDDGDDEGSLAVTVYDGWAGVPLHHALPGAPLHDALPAAARSIAWPALAPWSSQLGEQASDALDRVILPATLRRFPDPLLAHRGQSVSWGRGQSDGPDVVAPPPDARSASSLAELVCPHGDGRLNINTAPLWLLARVYHLHGLSLPTAVAEHRERGIPTLTAMNAPHDGRLPTVVVGSAVWHALITARWNAQRRSWWVVVAGMSTGRIIVQRQAVSDG